MQVARLEGHHAPDAALVDELARAQHGGHVAVVEGHAGVQARLLCSLRDAHGALAGHGHRLVQVHVLARLQRGDGHLLVPVVGRADGHHVDVVHIKKLAVVVGAGLEARHAHGLPGLFDAAGADAAEPDLKVDARIEQADAAQGLGVGHAHEAPADHANRDGFHMLPPLGLGDNPIILYFVPIISIFREAGKWALRLFKIIIKYTFVLDRQMLGMIKYSKQFGCMGDSVS